MRLFTIRSRQADHDFDDEKEAAVRPVPLSLSLTSILSPIRPTRRSLSLSLSLSHTHTHSYSYSILSSIRPTSRILSLLFHSSQKTYKPFSLSHSILPPIRPTCRSLSLSLFLSHSIGHMGTLSPIRPPSFYLSLAILIYLMLSDSVSIPSFNLYKCICTLIIYSRFYSLNPTFVITLSFLSVHGSGVYVS